MEFVFDDESSPEIQGSAAVEENSPADRFYEFFSESPVSAIPRNSSLETPCQSRKSDVRKYREPRISDISTTAPSGASELSSLLSPSLLDGPSYKQRRNRRRKERRKEEKRKHQGMDGSTPQVIENGAADQLPTAPQGEPSSHLQTTLGGVPISFLATQWPTFFSGHSHENKQSVLFGHLSAGNSGPSCETTASKSPIQCSAVSERKDLEMLRINEGSINSSSEESGNDKNEPCDSALSNSEYGYSDGDSVLSDSEGYLDDRDLLSGANSDSGDDCSIVSETNESSITVSSEEPESEGNKPWDGTITAKVLFRQHMADPASLEIDNAAAYRRMQMLRRIKEARESDLARARAFCIWRTHSLSSKSGTVSSCEVPNMHLLFLIRIVLNELD